jgi:tRNA nucleotidyltransferase (CCA-adding enzyme)
VRFDFKIDPETESEIKAVAASGLHHEIGGSRLKSELNYIFAHKQAVVMLRSLDQLGALRCLDSQLHLPKDFSLQIRRLRRWLQWFNISDPDAGLKLLRSYSEKAAKSPKELLLCENLKAWELSLPLPSQIVKVLRNYEAIALIIVAAQCSKPQRSILWQYLTKWQRVQPLLSGEDLKNLGYPEGKTLGTLLSQIRDATLDHKITTKAEAIALINRYQAVQSSST